LADGPFARLIPAAGAQTVKEYNHHFNRRAYYVVGEDLLTEPEDVFGNSPLETPGAPVHLLPLNEQRKLAPPFKFGRLFKRARELQGSERAQMIDLLTQLGRAMSDLTPKLPGGPLATTYTLPSDSKIPSGYTYLAQFLAHEITFDNHIVPPDSNFWPKGLRSPQIDLDSLYGQGPQSTQSAELYDTNKPGELKIGETQYVSKQPKLLKNDLPRDSTTYQALIGDERNDENLGVAQIHVAFIKFHNYVVNLLRENKCPADSLLRFARTHVVRHFQWIILNDLLAKILDPEVLKKVKEKKAWYFTKRTRHEVFMPLEFSAAAYRFGHSMVRRDYEWNSFHSTDGAIGGVPAQLDQLLEQTAFSGRIGKPGVRAVPGDWVIDWRRFFDFSSSNHNLPKEYILADEKINKAGKIDRVFNLHLEAMPYFKHYGLQGDKQLITVRNLLRGFALRLPSGEQIARRLREPVLTSEELLSGPYDNVKAVLSSPQFKDNTPLWYYIIKEAELNEGERLGPVGSRIVAETLVGLINRSRYSIFRNSGLPKVAQVLPEPSKANYQMIDLLHLADVVNPVDAVS
jgi:hypothetical protein